MGRKRGRPKGPVKNTSSILKEEDSKEDKDPNGNGNKRKSGASHKGKAKCPRRSSLELRLADKPNLTKEDLMCPICWSTLFEPTTLPCNHSLCEVCFRKHIDETALTCPCCRLRLSVWCRKNMRDDHKLLDEKLWNRMKIEFPKLVHARTNGEDTQNIFEDEEEKFHLESPNLDRSVLDGVLCEEPGQIKQEFENMLELHEKDIADERLREETASASLIKQMQEEENVERNIHDQTVDEDYLLAQKLQKEFEEAERLTRRSSAHKQNPAIRNLINQLNNNANHSPDITELPLTTQSKLKPSPRGNLVSFSKGKANSKKTNSARKKSATVTSSDVSRASQNVMSKFLSSSQNQLLSPESLSKPADPEEPMTPCCSKSFPVHDVRFSAFSPTKPSSNSRLIVPAESLAIPIPSVAGRLSPLFNRTSEEPGSSTKTPDSINSEVDRHFRPIRGAPKTPPRRRPDGTFLPEPKLLRTTPMKPGFSPSISAYIRSPLKQMPNDNRPSCATLEKRISNDSGRASDDSRSPDVEGVGDSPTTSLKGSESIAYKPAASYQNEMGRISEDYRVTPEDNPKTPENSKKRFLNDYNESLNSDSKKVKVEPIEIEFKPASPVKIESLVKDEPGSPSLLDEPFGQVPLSFDITCSQGIIKVEEDDEDYLQQEAEALKIFRKKAEQEAADRAFAESLQRDLNREVRSPGPRGRNAREKYSLRSWLRQPSIKQETIE